MKNTKIDDSGSACLKCGRRSFMMKLGLLAGTGVLSSDTIAMLPPSVSPKMIPDKKGAIKVRVIFAYHVPNVIQVKPDWPNVGYDFRPVIKNMTDALNIQVPDVEFIPTSCAQRDDTKKVVQADTKAGDIKGYVVVQCNCWNKCFDGVLENCDKPVLYTALPYAGDGGWLMRGSNALNGKHRDRCVLFASFDFSKVTKVAAAFSVLKDGTTADFVKKAEAIKASIIPPDTPPKGIKVIADKVNCVTPDEALAKLKEMKILSIHSDAKVYKNKHMERVAAEITKTFGVAVELVTFSELNSVSRTIPDAEVKKVADSWSNKANNIEYVSYDTIFGCARLYLGMKGLLAKRKAQAITINCLGGCYGGKLDAYPCLGFMQLQDDGLLGVCENDLFSTITMMAFSVLTKGRVGYVSDPALDQPNRAITYAHCVCTRRFFGPNGPESEFDILTHSEDRMGASVRSYAPIGEPVTTVKVNPLIRKIALHTGVIVANDLDDRACRTKIVARVTGDYSKMVGSWCGEEQGLGFNWHRVTFLGDFKSDVEAFAKKIGYEIVYES